MDVNQRAPEAEVTVVEAMKFATAVSRLLGPEWAASAVVTGAFEIGAVSEVQCIVRAGDRRSAWTCRQVDASEFDTEVRRMASEITLQLPGDLQPDPVPQGQQVLEF